MCSADVASALAMAGVLDYTPALNANLQVDDTGNTFAGTLLGKFRVYIDPYAANNAANQYYVVGYKGTSLMTLDSSIVLMFPSRWFVPLERTPSSLRSALRLATVWLLTPSHKEPQLALVLLPPTPTATIVAFPSRTSCDPKDSQGYTRGSSDPLFLSK